MSILGIVKNLTGAREILRNKILKYKIETLSLNLIGNWDEYLEKKCLAICSL